VVIAVLFVSLQKQWHVVTLNWCVVGSLSPQRSPRTGRHKPHGPTQPSGDRSPKALDGVTPVAASPRLSLLEVLETPAYRSTLSDFMAKNYCGELS